MDNSIKLKFNSYMAGFTITYIVKWNTHTGSILGRNCCCENEGAGKGRRGHGSVWDTVVGRCLVLGSVIDSMTAVFETRQIIIIA